MTSFGNTTGYKDTCRLRTRGIEFWDSYLAIHPSTHLSNKNVLYLQKRKLDKPSYVQLDRIYLPMSALKTYTRGLMARASDIHLTSKSLDILLRELGMKAPQSLERGPAVGRETATIPPSPSLPVLSTGSRLFAPRGMPYHPQIAVPKNNWGQSWEPGPSVRGATFVPSSPPLPMKSFSDTQSTPRSMPYRPQISVREDTLLITNMQRLSHPVPSFSTKDNYGSINTWSLPPPTTWSPRGRPSKIFRISNSIGRDNFLRCFKVALCLLLLGFVVFHTPWASIGSIFTKIGHSLTSVWSSCWGSVANGWGSFVSFFRNNCLNLITSISSIFSKIGHSLTSIWSSCSGFVANGWSSLV